jgi:integrase
VSTLKTYYRPVIGSKRVDSVSTEDILKILSPIRTTKTETAKRVQGRVENILDYAAAHKYRDPLNPARWRGHLDKLLPKHSRVKKVTHHPAMPHSEVPAFVAELSINDSVSSLALRFLILTATRTSEVLQAHWPEIDLGTAVWTIPAKRMKARRGTSDTVVRCRHGHSEGPAPH